MEPEWKSHSIHHDKENVPTPPGGGKQLAVRRSTPSIFGSVALLAETACPSSSSRLYPQQFHSSYQFRPIMTDPGAAFSPSSYAWNDAPRGVTSTPVLGNVLRRQQANQCAAALYSPTSLCMTSPIVATATSPSPAAASHITSFLQASGAHQYAAADVKVGYFQQH